MPMQLATLDGPQTINRLTDVRRVYRAAFRFEPGETDDFDALLPVHASRPDFRCVLAAVDGDAIGFGYGFTGRPGQSWRDDMAEAVGSDLAETWLDGHFEFAEFAVDPDHHRSGVGTAVYERLTAGLHHDRGVLTVVERNTPAIAFYEKQGWQVLHTGFIPSGGHGPYLIMGVRW